MMSELALRFSSASGVHDPTRVILYWENLQHYLLVSQFQHLSNEDL